MAEQNLDIKDFNQLSSLNTLDHLLISQSGGGAHGKMQVQLLVNAVRNLIRDGREVELRRSSTAIEWRYRGQISWTELVTLESLKGAKGDTGLQGKSLQFSWNGTRLGVRVEGDQVYSYVDLKLRRVVRLVDPLSLLIYTKDFFLILPYVLRS